jgi:hypothetical protein
VSATGRLPIERWLDACRFDGCSIGHLLTTVTADDRPDPWATHEVPVAELSAAQHRYLSVDQPVRQPIRPAIPGVEGFEA